VDPAGPTVFGVEVELQYRSMDDLVMKMAMRRYGGDRGVAERVIEQIRNVVTQ
jgi:hypothetical protein